MTNQEAFLLYEAINLKRILNCPLVGGDTSIQHRESDFGLHLVTVIGTATRPVLRLWGKGWRPSLRHWSFGRVVASGRHLFPPVRIAEALQLSAELGDDLHAMIDISDGLGKDTMAVASSSNVRFMLEASLIPCHLVPMGRCHQGR